MGNCKNLNFNLTDIEYIPPKPPKWVDLEIMLKPHFSDKEIQEVKLAFDAGFDIEYQGDIPFDGTQKLTISLSKDIVKYVECAQ